MSTRASTLLPNDAAEWDARLRAADCTDAERQAFKRWCEINPNNAASYDALQTMLAGLREAAEVPEIRSLREAALNAAPPVVERRRWFRPVGLAAAAGLVAVGLTYFAVEQPFESVPQRPPTYATAVGERSTTNLEDGSVAVLNTNTRLEVAFSKNERVVILLHGQALFDVAKDPARPFVVIAGEQRITAVGTVFDVRFEDQAVQVTLVEGVVDVVPKAPMGSDLVEPAAELKPVRLTAGQRLTTTAIAAPSVPRVEPADLERATMWQQGRVFFDDAPLSEAVNEMNRYSTTKVLVADQSLDKYRVNGMFRTGKQANFVMALEEYFPLEVERSGANRIVLKAQPQERQSRN